MALEQQPDRSRTAKDIALALWFPAFFVLGFMLFYLLPFHTPAPNEIPVAVVGQQGAAQVGAGLERAVPGGFDVSAIDSADRIRDAIFSRDVVAGFDPGAHTLYIARADGMQLSQVLQGVFAPLSAADGASLQVVDLASPAPGDGFGTSLFYVLMACNIAGYITVMMMAQAVNLSRRTKLLSLVGFGAAATVVCWVIGTAISAIPFDPAVMLVWFLLTQAVAWTTFGLAPLVKRALPAVAMGIFVLLSVPASGGAMPKEMLPGFFQAIHQVVPMGQAIDASRGLLYFEGTAVVGPVLGLLAWWLLGALLVVIGVLKDRRAADREDSADEDDGEDALAREDQMEHRIAEAVADGAAVGGTHQGSLAEARLLAHPVPTLIGRVSDAAGNAVPGVRVTVTDQAGAQLDVTSGSQDGRFAVRGRGDGWITVLVSAPGYEPVSQRLRLDGPVSHRSFLLGGRRPEPVGAPA